MRTCQALDVVQRPNCCDGNGPVLPDRWSVVQVTTNPAAPSSPLSRPYIRYLKQKFSSTPRRSAAVTVKHHEQAIELCFGTTKPYSAFTDSIWAGKCCCSVNQTAWSGPSSSNQLLLQNKHTSLCRHPSAVSVSYQMFRPLSFL